MHALTAKVYVQMKCHPSNRCSLLICDQITQIYSYGFDPLKPTTVTNVEYKRTSSLLSIKLPSSRIPKRYLRNVILQESSIR